MSAISFVLDRLHGDLVFTRRTRVLAKRVAEVLATGSVLDVGAGNGTIGKLLKARGHDVQGIDVHARATSLIPVSLFDGRRIPHEDKSFDNVIFVDVLHHCEDPVILLQEAARVARERVVIKDHLREGLLAEGTLRLMDWVGNARHGVALPYNYFNRLQWKAAFDHSGLRLLSWQPHLDLYPLPASLVFERQLHFVAALSPQ